MPRPNISILDINLGTKYPTAATSFVVMVRAFHNEKDIPNVFHVPYRVEEHSEAKMRLDTTMILLGYANSIEQAREITDQARAVLKRRPNPLYTGSAFEPTGLIELPMKGWYCALHSLYESPSARCMNCKEVSNY